MEKGKNAGQTAQLASILFASSKHKPLKTFLLVLKTVLQRSLIEQGSRFIIL